MHRPSLSHVRSELERKPRDPFAVDPVRAIDAFSAVWGIAYDVSIGEDGRWQAARRDGLPGVSGAGPDDLLGKIKADYKARPVVIR